MKVLATNATRSHGIATIRYLAENGCEVVGVDNRNLPLNIHSRFTKPYYIFPEAQKYDYVDAIVKIIKKEKPNVTLPIIDTKLVSKHRREIEKHTYCLSKSCIISYYLQ